MPSKAKNVTPKCHFGVHLGTENAAIWVTIGAFGTKVGALGAGVGARRIQGRILMLQGGILMLKASILEPLSGTLLGPKIEPKMQ